MTSRSVLDRQLLKSIAPDFLRDREKRYRMTQKAKLAAALAAPRNKYGNRHTVIDSIRFDSAKEGKRWSELKLLERAGEISDLQRQVPFTLLRSVHYARADMASRALKYVADFTYTDKAGNSVIEDVKGVLTSEFKIKRHMMKALLGLDITIVK